MERQVQDWQKREGPRREVSLTALVTLETDQQIRVLIRNLSYEGCHFLSERNFAVGETVVVAIPGMGSMRAQVRWSEGDMAGAVFLLGKSVVEDRRARLGV